MPIKLCWTCTIKVWGLREFTLLKWPNLKLHRSINSVKIMNIRLKQVLRRNPNMLSRELDKRFGKAIDLACKKNHEFVTLEHFLFCLVEAPLIVEILEKLESSPTEIKNELDIYINKNPIFTDEQKKDFGGIENWK